MPEVSIIIPVYNVELYLRHCLDSVLAQTFRDIEAILVDDGSTDDSGKICDEYAEKDARFRVVHQENAGLSGARNTGIEKARGSYLYFLDSDDWVERDTVEKLYEGVAGSGGQYAVCGYYKEAKPRGYFSPQMRPEADNRLGNLLRYARKEFSYAVWNKLYRRSIVIENNLRFYEGEKYVEDHAFNLKYLLFCEKVSVIRAPLYHYRIREGQITAESPEKRLPTYIEDTKKLIEDFKSYGKYEEYKEVLAVHFAARFNEYIGGLAKDKFLCKPKSLLIKEIKNLYRETGFSKVLKHAPLIKKERLFLALLGQGNAGAIIGCYRLYALLRRVMSLWGKTKYCLREKIKDLVLYRSIWLKRNYLRYIQKDNDTNFLSDQSLKIGTKPRLFLIGTPEYENVGDHAIAVAEKQYLGKELADYSLIEVTENEAVLHLRELKKYIQSTDIILLQGGGNMGSEYPDQEMIRKHVIKAFPDNKTVVFPQSVFFSDKPINHFRKKEMRSYYSGHINLLLCARERRSYEIMLENFEECKIALMPDMAFRLQSAAKASKRNGVLICLRSDKESILSWDDKAKINCICRQRFNNVSESDTCIDYRVKKENREKILDQIVMRFRSSELVVTDRLHGMILAAVTETPCVAFSNSNHKIVESFEWIKGLGFVRLCDNLERLGDLISAALSCAAEYDRTAFDEYYDAITLFIRENSNGQN